MLDRADYPEQVGVDSDVVSDLIKFFEKLVYNIDSLMVIRHGKVACECHWHRTESIRRMICIP